MRIPQNREVNNNAVRDDAEETEQVTARRSGPFAQIPSSAVYDQRLSGDAFRLLAALTTHADRHGECFPRQDSLAYALGVNQSSISRWLAELVKLGYVVIVGKRRYGARGWRYVYQIQYQPPVPEDMQHCISSPEDMQPRICTAVHNKNISIKNRELTPSVPSSSYPKVNVKQPPWQKRSEKQPDRAPAAQGGEKKNHEGTKDTRDAMERDPLYRTFAETLGYEPVMPRERQQWRLVINNFRRERVTPEQLRAVIALYIKLWPIRKCSPMAIEHNWSLLIGGETHGTGLAIAGAAREATRAREQAERDAFDWRAERDRWRREFAGMGLTLESVYGDSVDDPNLYRPRHITDR